MGEGGRRGHFLSATTIFNLNCLDISNPPFDTFLCVNLSNLENQFGLEVLHLLIREELSEHWLKMGKML